ncbi:type IV pilus assembly protein FimV [Lentisalinibacter sediminis]|uniref:type IV pilus assembly protein FimV n=1 Tax=Lentisalinibacter sediminis TaxID=2992237 RepID=UPI003866CF0D
MNDETKQATGTAVDRADPAYRAGRAQRAGARSSSHSTPRSTLVASCVCALLAGGPAAALELGEPVVRSGLGQPLEVVVPYATWGNERLTADCVSLVRGQPGDSAGLPALTSGRVSSTAGNRLVIRSDRSIREPLLGMNLKVDCPSTPFIIRSYTLIIDPPGFTAAAAEPAPVPAPRRAPAEPAAVLPAAPASGRASRGTVPAPSEPVSPGSAYRVRVGDTLSTIAQRVTDRPGGIWATAERIFAANPEAFIGGDMDRLRAGSVLEIPATDTIVTAANTPNPATQPADPSAAGGEPARSAPTAGAGGNAQAAAPAASATAATATSATPATAPATSTASAAAAERIRPAVRQAMDEMAAEPPSPFKSEAAGDTAGGDTGVVQTPAGPAPRITDSDPAPRSGVSPLFAALFGAGIGLLLGLVIFRSSLREFFRRAPTPAAARKGLPAAGAGAVADGNQGEDTDVIATPVFEREEPDVIVSEEEWSDAAQSKLRSLDLDFGDEEDGDAGGKAIGDLSDDASDELVDDVITEQELAVARMNFPEFEDSDTVEETDGGAVLPPEERIDESMIMEVDTGAELAADTDAQDTSDERNGDAEDTGTLATVADLEMLEEDYEQEFTATQRLAKQLADAAIALDQEITTHGDEVDESIAETIAATRAETRAAEARAAEARAAAAGDGEQTGATAVLERDGDIIDEGDQTAVLSADDATTEMPSQPEDAGDTVEHTGVYAAATAELPSAEQPDSQAAADDSADDDDESDRETAVIPLSEKRRA